MSDITRKANQLSTLLCACDGEFEVVKPITYPDEQPYPMRYLHKCNHCGQHCVIRGMSFPMLKEFPVSVELCEPPKE